MEDDTKQREQLNREKEADMASSTLRLDLKAFHISKMLESDLKLMKRQVTQDINDARIWAMIAILVAVCSLAIHMFNYIL